MRVIVKNTYIERRIQLAQWLPLVALGLLAGSMLVSWKQPDQWSLTLALVGLGFIFSVAGSYYVDRFGGRLPHFAKVPEALKGLDDSYTLLIYRLPVPFVLVEPGGLTAIQVKGQGSEVSYRDGHWRHSQSWRFFRQLGGQESLGEPDRQAHELEKRLVKYLRKRLPDTVEAPVRSVVLFIDPEVHLEAEDAPVPALRAAKLKGWLRSKEGRRPALPVETRRQLAEALGIAED